MEYYKTHIEDLLRQGKEEEIYKYISSVKAKIAKEEIEKERIKKLNAEREEKLNKARGNLINSFMAYLEVLLNKRLDAEDMKELKDILVKEEKEIIHLNDTFKKLDKTLNSSDNKTVKRGSSLNTDSIDKYLETLLRLL